MSQLTIALITAALAGVGVKVLDRFWHAGAEETADLGQFRRELAARVSELEKRLEQRDREYYDLLGRFRDQTTHLEIVETELAALKVRVSRGEAAGGQ